MTTAWVPLATTTLGSATASVTFGSIPSGYRDLVLVMESAISSNGQMSFRFNGDTGSNYSIVHMSGISSGALSASATSTGGYFNWFNQLANTSMLSVLQVMDYSATDKHKSGLVRTYATGTDSNKAVTAMANRWANTAAITSLLVRTDTGNFNIGSTFTLYGSNRL